MSVSSGSNTSPGQAASSPQAGAADPNAFNPMDVNLTDIVANGMSREVVCYLNAGENEYDGGLGVRISSIFVILVVSSAVTFFPVIATRSSKVKVPLYVYLFARYFGAGVILATAFIHLLDPAYEEIGPASCVGMTGGWAQYSWPPAIAMTSGVCVFLMNFYSERYVEKKYGMSHGHSSDEAEDRAEQRANSIDAAMVHYRGERRKTTTHQFMHSGDQDRPQQQNGDGDSPSDTPKKLEDGTSGPPSYSEEEEDAIADQSFKQNIAAFLILEFGVLFHSVIIGLTLGSAGSEFAVLYPVIVFHQSFEGLGIGARLSAIAFPKRFKWMPYWLCAGYGLTTPIAIAAGLGVRTSYNSSSNDANIVSGVLDSISAGILLYTAFVQMLARDFLFNPERTKDDKQLTFMILSVLFGAGIMALLGKWA